MDLQRHPTWEPLGPSTTQHVDSQPRRALAISEMLNHSSGPVPHIPHYSSQPYPWAIPPSGELLNHPPRMMTGGVGLSVNAHTRQNFVPPPRAPPNTTNHYLNSGEYPSYTLLQGHWPPGPLPPAETRFPFTTPQPPRPRDLPIRYRNMQSPPRPMVPMGRRKPCMICLETFFDGAVENNFPHNCQRCSSGTVCAGCLRDWFLNACRDESKMPPKCCSIIPLSTVSSLLNANEIQLYKSKYEEWSTPDRLYCPKPSCSTFIPPRLLVDTTRSGQTNAPSNRQNSGSFIPYGHIATHQPSRFSSIPTRNEWAAEPSFIPPQTRQLRANITCPSCCTLICTKCRSFTHLGPCPESDIGPELEAQLKKWNIKRCPKCRAGVRKMFGCAHIECRCGAHFCWECLLPINVCDGSCEDELDDFDPAEYILAEDDLDGRAGFHDGDGHEFGNEPYGTIIDTWACDHRWAPAVRPNNPLLRRANWECHHCFRTVKFPDINTGLVIKDEDTVMTGVSTEPSWASNIYGEPAWQCMSGHMQCNNCPKNPPRNRLGDEIWMWKCDCGVQCQECYKSLVRVQEEKAEMAWDCRCGMVICGECSKSVSL